MSIVCKVCEAYNMKDPQTFTKKATISPRNIEIARKLFNLPNLDFGKLCNLHYAPLLLSLKEWRANQEAMEEGRKGENNSSQAVKKFSISKKTDEPNMSFGDDDTEDENPKRTFKRKRECKDDENNSKKLHEEIEELNELIKKKESETRERLDFMERSFRAQVDAQQKQIKILQKQIIELSDKIL